MPHRGVKSCLIIILLLLLLADISPRLLPPLPGRFFSPNPAGFGPFSRRERRSWSSGMQSPAGSRPRDAEGAEKMNSVRAPGAGERIHSFTKISFSGWVFSFWFFVFFFFSPVSRAGLGAAAE